MKILISGGHLTPALAVIDEAAAKHKDVSFVFVGRKYLQEKEQMEAREHQEMKGRKIPFYAIDAFKFHRSYLLRNLFELKKVFISLKHARILIKKERPDIFLSFGGYLAIPLALVCAIRKIPIVTHEQTSSIGLANTVIGWFAQKILISFESTAKLTPKAKTVFTGNPLRPTFYQIKKEKPDWLKGVRFQKPLLVVTGGSQGSYVINHVIMQSLSTLVHSYVIVHQCGGAEGNRYYKDLIQAKQKLTPNMRKSYIIREWIDDADIAWLFEHAHAVIARAGANTVTEIMQSSAPAIFIPLPFSHNQEQQKNAEMLEDYGSALILQQKKLISKNLLKTLAVLEKRHTSMKKKAEKMAQTLRTDAAAKILAICFDVYTQKITSAAPQKS
jgi:UDP-N-acetylglucosamine--N-acetylmuramyl-(pentapeptide) pyrophosphoryl-undecaprenol N-acetylglucosamine transferase